MLAPPVRFDLRTLAADLSAFPRRAWGAALRDALRELPDASLNYGDRVGAGELRTVLASYLGRARGVAAEPRDVIVVTGIMQAVSLLARTLRRAGVERVGVEDPGFPPHRMVFAREGLRVVPIPVDAGGLVVDGLDAAGVGAVLCTPTHQYPRGMALAPERRAALVEWAAARDAWIIEDDYDGEYRFDRDPVGALQALAPGARDVPRLGVQDARAGAAAGVDGRRAGAGRGRVGGQGAGRRRDAACSISSRSRASSSTASWTGTCGRMRGVYRRRRDALVSAAERWVPEVELEGISAGLHVSARLPDGVVLGPLLQRAWEGGIGVFGYEHGGVARVLLGYANLPEPSIEPAIRALAQIGFGTST